MKKLLKVKYKLLGIFILVTAIPILLVGAYLNFGTREIVLSNTMSEVEANADKMEMRLKSIIKRVINISDLIYINQDLKTFLAGQYDSPLEVYNAYNQYPVFDDYLTYYEEIEKIQFFMKKDIITDSHFIYANKVIQNQHWYQNALMKRGRLTWLYMQDHWTSKKYLALTRTVFDHENQPLGVLVIYISPDILKSVVEGVSYNTFITLDNKRIVYNQNIALLGRHANFYQNRNADIGNYVMDKTINEETVKINVHSFRPEKSLDNTIQIATQVPIDGIIHEPNTIFTRGFLISLGALSISLILIGFFTNSFHKRIQQLRRAMFQVAKGNFHITQEMKGHDEIKEVYKDLQTTSKSVQKIIDEVYIHKIKEETWKRKQKEMDFKMLASQINPHFLYNTLEMIRMKAILNKDPEVAKVIKMLSKMMRSSLKRTDQSIPLSEEVALIENYLEIQKLRFGEHLSYKMEIDENILSYKITPLLIQPLVENAIIHGLEMKEEPGMLRIRIQEDGDDILVEVNDNGVGMSLEKLNELNNRMKDQDYQSNGNSIGLHNVHQRISLLYGDKYGIRMDSVEGSGTTMSMNLPKQKN
ncbi:sensor histidine kinase [Gracilibacillus dipsosauri]|uniref:sensor histidine kinase n=1 Tax=Gracilibacillus dipsosauri TaxID=178340 RepID=UPI001FECF89F|nr:sensor histidine kinase [Gracilibacillus dipsosauri]